MATDTPIAIVGLDGLFPGAPDHESFWANIVNGRDAAGEPPKGRWLLSPEEVYDPRLAHPDHVYSKRACFIRDLPPVPEDGYGIGRKLLDELDPVFRVLLHAGHAAFGSAQMDSVDRQRVGVFLGNLALPSEKSSALAHEYLGGAIEEKILGRVRPGDSPSHVQPLNRYVAGLPAAVLAQSLGLGGGSMTLDAACASSLYAVRLAMDELRASRLDAVLTGGVSRPDSLYTQMGFSQLRALSPTGVCSPFDAKGNGLVVGEGAGVFVLKRLDDAIQQGDRIRAVIRGVGLSNDIGGSLLAPQNEGQLRAMRAAYAQAGLDPQDIDLIECHATGTPLGDATEVESLRRLWGTENWSPGQCVIGSVKSNVGHLLTAAGSAALTKVLLAFEEETLPPTAHYSEPASGVVLEGSPFEVLTRSQPWRRRNPQTPRRAAVSAFGFGGINAHLVVEEWTEPTSSFVADTARPIVELQSKVVPIAVVGMDAHVGPWESLRSFQERIFGTQQEDAPEPPTRWWGIEHAKWFEGAGLTADEFRGFFIGELNIPRDRFRIPPREMEDMLPQQLLALKVAAGALDDCTASLDESHLNNMRERTGVFVGIGLDLNSTNFTVRWSMLPAARKWAETLGLELSDEELDSWVEELRRSAGPPLTANRTMGALGSIVASRIAREFRFGGPSFTISSEDTSSMRALETAMRALQTGEIERALVGGVDCIGDPRSAVARRLAGHDTEQPLAEGAVAVVLKRLDDAERDGDRIYAVVDDIAGVNASGPNGAADTVTRAIDGAVQRAHISVEDFGYLDIVAAEAPALKSDAEDMNRPHVRGSIKTDIGDLGAATGLTQFVKSCLALYQEILPGGNETDTDKNETGFRSLSSPEYWLRDRIDGPRRAGVVQCGTEGNAVAVVLRGYDSESSSRERIEHAQPLGAFPEGLFVVEGANAAALDVALTRLQQFVESEREISVDRLARLWWRGNTPDASRPLALTIVSRSTVDLLKQIDYARQRLDRHADEAIDGTERTGGSPLTHDRIFFAPEPLGPQGEIAFVYPGSGNQYSGMGRDIGLYWPEIYRRQDSESQRLRSQVHSEIFWDDTDPERVKHDHQAALFGQVTLGTVYTDLLMQFGVKPQAVVGYSLGETAGLFSMRAWTHRDEMFHRIQNSTLFTEELAGDYNAVRKAWGLPGHDTVDWALGVIDRPAKVVRAALKDHKKVYNLIVNTLQECVVGGDPHAVAKLVKKLDCEFFPLHGVTTVHCEVAEEVKEPYRALHVLPTTPPKDVRFYSGAWGTAYNVSEEKAADAVLAQAIYGIDYPKLINAAYEDGARIFVEMGPGASCSRMISEILVDHAHAARSLDAPGREPVGRVLRMLARLIAERVPVDLSVLYGRETRVEAHGERTKPRNPLQVRCGGKPFHVALPTLNHKPQMVEQPAVVAERASTPTLPPEVQVSEPVVAPLPSRPTIPVPQPVVAPILEPVAAAATAEPATAHEAFLRISENTTSVMSDTIQFQMNIIAALGATGEAIMLPSEPPVAASVPPVEPPTPAKVAASISPNAHEPVALDKDQCFEFAVGSIGRVLGEAFAEADAYPTRVRLPDEPLMLVDRIVAIHGEPKSMTHGRVVTEHDVLPGAWYLDAGRIPTCIAVEAGQADLFLSGYLGIDFETRGLAMYRLLDAAITFHRHLPVPGETIHYDIRIERFFRQGETYLFRFNFDATVDGEPLLTMRNGCAGFFTREELDAGVGVVRTALDLREKPGVLPQDWTWPVPLANESYSDEQVTALREGNLAGCFGAMFQGLPLANPSRLPGGRMKLVDRIRDLEPQGGRYGLGVIRGEMDIRPDDWFLTCHFIDDQVMPGTLMYECCLHTLRIYLMRMGWVGESDAIVFEPVPGVTGQLKCRGEVNKTSHQVVYEVEVKEFGFNPNAFVIADTLMYVDGKPAVEMTNMSLQLTGLTRESVEELWRDRGQPSVATSTVYDYDSILAFSSGKPSEAFGEPYEIFDRDRKIARLPRPPFQFLDRVVSVNHPAWDMTAGGVIEAEYDVPTEAWYFAADRADTMPFGILLETALQPCGWFAAYMGSALHSNEDLKFRNLGGRATQHRAIGPDIGTIRTRVKCTAVSQSAGMIIQHYQYDLTANGEPIYSGDTYFGYFSAKALENQIGIRDAKRYEPDASERSVSAAEPYPREVPFPDAQWRMVDRVELYSPVGGPHGLGFVRGGINVDPGAWFFEAHFYQDPVWPGSLGLEGFLQLMKYAAVERWQTGPRPRFEMLVPNKEHAWVYRGQVIPRDARVTIDVYVTAVDDQKQVMRADGFLEVDGRVIYQMNGFEIRLVDGESV